MEKSQIDYLIIDSHLLIYIRSLITASTALQSTLLSPVSELKRKLITLQQALTVPNMIYMIQLQLFQQKKNLNSKSTRACSGR